MNLKMLIKDMEIKEMTGITDIEITGIAYDSRKVKAGDVFVAAKGEKCDGHDFISDAVKKGAVAVVYEKDENKLLADSYQLTAIKVSDSREALAYLSNNFYEKPSDKLTVIGITGTNGKTTATYLIKAILEAWGKDAGLIGTIDYLVKDRHYDAPHTTPEALEFQSVLNEMVSAGCTHVVTEVSSHALAQKRVDYTGFSVAVFTNLTRDHLDFHITMEDYFRAKEKLFKELLLKGGTSVINFDDIYGRRLISELRNSKVGNLLTYGIETGADIVAVNIKNSFDGLMFDINFNGSTYKVQSPLIGIYNVYNILSAIGAAVSLNVPWDTIISGIKKMGSVKGRFQKVDLGQNFLCIVDYAHTEDALERLICAARELTKGQGKIITVFGCGGNRDKGKRPRMAAIATKLSDYVLITSDNPRSEEPMEIIKEIEKGALRMNYTIEPDREKAIQKAVETAEEGDILLIAGKGHEDYQEVKDARHKFSDMEMAEKAIRGLWRF
ncbi:MAG: UDP-N-acetylmuramoyl-L-alanyl-D-glutamate--2,6-diaminopimelate ligase [Nitrospirae bacterium GWF2_44_13]|nr:MAG: UDP-N-acetylmuramoyl-L-alanyl-D-glutamate--2,6-diaminopimelate ligase [Nitrospirae bacterium GWF2_44_13]OGW66187.1 MAG: UDP-N-acetylmuramoyl-L-alanyl-D-glutamate--2,6-diaminopimelate ligase [Nitrospirae bacterium RIFOXYA2_FULL_44_9]